MSSVTIKRHGMTKFNKGHPWIFRDNLKFSRENPVGLYDLFNEEGSWLTKGLLNPQSKIAFRVLTSESQFQTSDAASLVFQLGEKAIAERQSWIEKRLSCRLIHGESDHLSSLIVDLFFTTGDRSDIFLVVQSQSAGMDSLQEHVLDFLKQWSDRLINENKDLARAHILLKNDSSKRARDGVSAEKTQIIAGESQSEPVKIRVGSLNHDNLLVNMKADLFEGQKTGFFLDQSFNIDVVYELALRMKRPNLKVLDICSYVGQWSAKLSKGLKSQGVDISCTALDSSSAALGFTKENVEDNGGRIETHRVDVFKSEWPASKREFDIVICDPPALIKNRKDMNAGKHGYTKLNALAIERVKKDGLIVSCSCSGVLSRDDFKELIEKSAVKAGRRVLWMSEGRQSPDHPIRDWFPEGEYLKCFVGRLLD